MTVLDGRKSGEGAGGQHTETKWNFECNVVNIRTITFRIIQILNLVLKGENSRYLVVVIIYCI